MIIALFHVLYLFGKLIYTKYSKRKQIESHDIVDIECVHRGVHANMNSSFRNRNQGKERLAQPPGDNSDDEKEMTSDIKFFPPAYIQRYVAVQKVLEDVRYKGKIRKVVDFGCAELGFVIYLKNTPGIEEILCVDIDKKLLEYHEKKASPLHVDYLHTRSKPLTISIIQGSVTHNDKLLEKTDAVICIELIEHLYPDTLADLPNNIFGFIKPQVAVMTTPNYEFNVLFKSSGFRHHDHKFEWTRDQFREWAENVVSRFPDYEVTMSGICEGPAGSENLGCCSQMAVFHRRPIPNEHIVVGVEGLFNVINIHEYPFHVDNRSDEQKILDDTVYFIRSYSMYSLEFSEEVPLSKLLDPLKKYCVTIETIKELLEQNGWTIADREEGPVVLIPEPSESEESEDQHWNDLDLSWNDRNEIESDWDLDPGPPSHYTAAEIAEIAREDWNDIPSVVVDLESEKKDDEGIGKEDERAETELKEEKVERKQSPKREETELKEENELFTKVINNSNTETIRPLRSEESLENPAVKKEEFIAEDDESKFQEASNSSLSIKSSNTVENSSPLTFSFKEVLNHTTELEPQRLSDLDYESRLSNSRSEKISSSEKLPRKTYRKSYKKPQKSSKTLLDELGSLCSIYLESSRNDNSKTCFQDLSNLSFESTISATSSMNSKFDEDLSFTESSSPREGDSFTKERNPFTKEKNSSVKKLRVDDSFSTCMSNSSSQLEKSEESQTELKRKSKKNEDTRKTEQILSESDLWDGLKTPESISKEDFSQSSSQISLPTFNVSGMSSSSLENSYPEEINSLYKSTPIALKGRNETALKLHDKIESHSDTANTDVEDAANLAHVHIKTSVNYSSDSQEFSKTNESITAKRNFVLNLPDTSNYNLEYKDSESPRDVIEEKNSNTTETTKCLESRELIKKSDTELEEIEIIRDHSEIEKVFPKRQESFVFEESRALKNLDLPEITEMNLASCEILDTPPNSSSPEVMDSGYPNSASAHDITPEYDLPSIEQDKISDSDSPSIEEAPRPGFFELELENGDLANNNRDDEGNNMIAVEDNEEDDLQPLIDVLEDDLENENDIYVLQNGFPAWLLRILQMQEIGIAGRIPLFGEGIANLNFNEGFSSSSEEEVED